MEYLAQGVLPIDRTLAHHLKKLVVRYFLQNRILFKKGYSRDPLRCLGLKEVGEVIREVHSDDCGSHKEDSTSSCYYWGTIDQQ